MERAKKTVFWARDPSLTKQIYLSPAFESIWGTPATVLEERPNCWADFVLPEDRENRNAMKMLKAHAEKGEDATFQDIYRIMRPDNTIRWIKDTCFPIYNDQKKCIGFAGVAEDITEEKEYELALIGAKSAAEAANKIKSQFIQDATHNALTPLAGIHGAKELFKMYRHTFPLEQQEWIDILCADVDRFQDMINRILDFSRIEEGHFEIKHVPMDLHKLVFEVAASVRHQANKKGLELIIDYPDNVPHTIINDEYCLNSILLNLVGNAIKFTDLGSVTLSIALNDNKLIIKTIDTGCGIAPEDLDKIFGRFTKVLPASKRDNTGYGLGLSTVQCMVGYLHGDVTVQSEIGKGSTFIVTLPLEGDQTS